MIVLRKSTRVLGAASWTLLASVLLCFPLCVPLALGQAPDEDDRKAREKERHHQQQDAENAKSRREVQELADSAELAIKLVTQLEQEATKLHQDLDVLLVNDDGKRIATDDIAAMTFLRVHEHPRLKPEEVSNHKQLLEDVLEHLQEALQAEKVGFVPDTEQEKEIEAHVKWITEALALVREQSKLLNAILADVRTDVDVTDVQTLKDTIDAYYYERISAWARARKKGEKEGRDATLPEVEEKARIAESERARAEAERLLAQARAEIERMKIDFEIRLNEETAAERDRLTKSRIEYDEKLAELKRLRKQADSERYAKDVQAELKSEKTREAAENQKKVALAKSPEVQALLAPFVTKAYSQPGKKTGARKTGVSLSALRASGALQPTVKGLTKLHRLGTKKQEDKERPRWGFASYFNRMSPEDREQLQEAQDYLNELGEVMVELGMLAP